MAATLLIVDDDKLTRETLAGAFADTYRVLIARNGVEALACLAAGRVDLVLSDLQMPDMDGLALMERLADLEDPPATIFVTGHATVESAVRAMQLGAHDYVTKPIHLDRLALLLDKALEARALRAENDRLRRRLRESRAATEPVARSATMRRVLDLVEQVAPTDASVLIEGESGTGKELVAHHIHEQSPRADAPLVKVNCAAFAEGLLESELFGHERGAFTGALATRKGRFELADGGTQFLDEIGDLPAPAQVKLLRFLQERTFERVCGNRTHRVDVRIVSATHRDLADRVTRGLFREDLYYRLRVVRIVLPPLRTRREDIASLVERFVAHFGKIHGRPVDAIDDEVMRLLEGHPWPGNVRELMNCLESMVVTSHDGRLSMDGVPDHLLAAGDGDLPRTGMLAELERRAIAETLLATGGNKVEADRRLGIGVRTLYRKIETMRIGPTGD